MSVNVTKKVEFQRRIPNGAVQSCTLEQFEDGCIYVVGDELGELIVEFADDAYEKAVSQLEELGYVQFSEPSSGRPQAG